MGARTRVLGGWLAAAATVGLASCSIVLDPEDYLEDPGVTPPPPEQMCHPLPPTPPRWASCPFDQQGPSLLGGDLERGELALGMTPGGDSVPPIGAVAIIESGARATVGVFDPTNVDLSSGYTLNDMAPLIGARHVALRGVDPGHVALGVLAASSDDAEVVAWQGSVDADSRFELNPVASSEGVFTLGRAGIVGGLVPDQEEPNPVRHVWRDRRQDDSVVFVSLDPYGGDYVSSDPHPAPADEFVEVADTAGPWVAVSTPDLVRAWSPFAGGEPMTLPSPGRTGPVAMAYASGCNFLVANPRDHEVGLQQYACEEGCTVLRLRGGAMLPAGGLASAVALTAMPGGGWALAVVRRPLDEPPRVGVFLLTSAGEVVGEPIELLTPAEIVDPPDLGYVDVKIAAIQRGPAYHVVVVASLFTGATTGNPLHHWIAGLHGCAR